MASLEAPERGALLDAARRSIESGVARGWPLLPDPEAHSPALRAQGASFVTLERGGALRGCIGTIDPIAPLVVDVASNAYSAAFRDPRFPPLDRQELGDLEIHLSLLSARELLVFASEKDLIGKLRPGVDGLLLEDAGRRGTFLPAVWEKIPEPREFLRQLKRKAGLAPDHWSASLRVWRYTAESVD